MSLYDKRANVPPPPLRLLSSRRNANAATDGCHGDLLGYLVNRWSRRASFADVMFIVRVLFYDEALFGVNRLALLGANFNNIK